jgi:hypothetical protein
MSYGVNLMLDGLFGSGDPQFLYLAVMRSQAESDDGQLLDEPEETQYRRVKIPNNKAHWPDAKNGIKTNGRMLVTPGAGEDWGNIRYWAILDAPEAGHVLRAGSLTPRRVSKGRALRFPPGSIAIAGR